MPWSEKVTEQFVFGKCKGFLMLCTTFRELTLGQFCSLSVRVQIYIFCLPAKPPICHARGCPGQECFCSSHHTWQVCFFPPEKKALYYSLESIGWKGMPSSAQIRDHREGKTQKSNFCLKEKRAFLASLLMTSLGVGPIVSMSWCLRKLKKCLLTSV